MNRIVVLSIGLVLASSGAASGAAIVRSAAGADAASITAMINQFRADIGGVNNGAGGGPFFTGRREINWDAPALDAFASPALMPPDFFNPVSPPPGSPRGAQFSTPGTGFLVSRRAVQGNPAEVRFGDINPSYPAIFQAFSAERLFVAQGSTVTDVTFFVPSSPTTPATVSGFGAVFADVDLDNSTSIEAYDSDDTLLFSQHVSPANNGLSFLGVSFNAGERIARIRITAGNFALGANVNDGFFDETGFQDLVAMDDFFYGEPIPSPGPGALTLVAAAMLCNRRRRD